MIAEWVRRRGFTIVEILIIIVIIAILAALVVIAYNGIQQRARVSIAQSEMRSVGQSAQVFRVEYNRSPVSPTDFSEILKKANVYNSTRTDAKSYAICADVNGYAFVAWNPVVQGYKNGDVLYLYSYGGTQQLYELTNSSLSSNNQLDKICDEVYDTSTFDAWTFDIP
jgi:prepilin-type N-terminal cleavage/methylation domain-containing protein